ncbi:MAG: class I SAM-dependent methyltransferase [Candidatus Thorarchaeota archaeon]|jgi:magnesium-protoporphyrin O-methyltransferase
MSTCQCQGIELEYDQKVAVKELEKYRKDGPIKNTRMLIDALIAEDISEMKLLDIGGGVGAIQYELLKAGVSSCLSVEASSAFLEAAKEEANRQGHSDRISHLHGDFVELAKDIPHSELVTLDRVICCYDNVEGLVGKSSMKALRFYGLVYPRDNLLSKIIIALENIISRIKRSSFRAYVHRSEKVDGIIRSNGFEKRFYREVGVWQIVVYERSPE